MTDCGAPALVTSAQGNAEGGSPPTGAPRPPTAPTDRGGWSVHWSLLLLRYLLALVSVIAGSALLYASNRTVLPLPTDGRFASGDVAYADKSPGAIAVDQRLYLLLGLLGLAAAATLVWRTGPTWRWLLLAGVALVAAPMMLVSLPPTAAFYGDSRTGGAIGDAVCFVVLAAVYAGLCYPASRIGRQRVH